MNEPLIHKVKNGTCPFTGQRYDCARCELKPEEHPIPSQKRPGFSEIHCCFCITRFATGQTTKPEVMRLAKGFTREDGSHPRSDELLEYFRDLYRYGVEVIPLCKCERFCFRHGCRGDGQPKESGDK